MDKRRVIYYDDELNDEFSLAVIEAKKIDGDYVYCHDSAHKKLTHFFWYRIVATPIAFLYTRIVFHHKIVGKKLLKPYRKKGYFTYGNHTQDIADAFIPNMLNVPQSNYVIAHPNNVSMPYLGRITPSLGALPLPDDMKAYRNFIRAIERRISEGHTVVIYPEAHIWPYYTRIRPFADTSFAYPIKCGAPSFCFTNTYQRRRFSRKPRIVTYIDGPFFADGDVPAREQKKNLRDKIYACMCERAKASTVARIEYIKRNTDSEKE